MDALIPHRRIQIAHKNGRGALFELHALVPQVLARPAAVFSGLLRDEDDDRDDTDGWLCYTGKPTTRYDYHSAREIPVKNRVLLVYVNKDRKVYNHRWEEEDEDKPGVPADAKLREPHLSSKEDPNARFKDQLI